MLRRWLITGIIYIALGLPFAYFVVTSEDQKPWLIAAGLYFVIATLVGNWFIFGGGTRGRK